MLVTEETFYKIIQDTWASTLEFAIDLPSSEEFSAKGHLTVCVRISGQWNGELCLYCPMALARLVAAAIFRVEANKAGDDEIVDALSELIHIVGGNLKALLPQPVTVSLPLVLDPMMSSHTAENKETVCRLGLYSKGYPFVVSLTETATSDAGNPIPDGHDHSLPADTL